MLSLATLRRDIRCMSTVKSTFTDQRERHSAYKHGRERGWYSNRLTCCRRNSTQQLQACSWESSPAQTLQFLHLSANSCSKASNEIHREGCHTETYSAPKECLYHSRQCWEQAFHEIWMLHRSNPCAYTSSFWAAQIVDSNPAWECEEHLWSIQVTLPDNLK